METNICRIEAKGGGGGLNTGVCRYVFTRVFMHAIKITSGQMARVYTLVYARHDDIAGILLYRARNESLGNRSLKLLLPTYEYKGIYFERNIALTLHKSAYMSFHVSGLIPRKIFLRNGSSLRNIKS